MQAVILAGGLGTRMKPLTEAIPKAMVPVNGRPFLDYQLGLLRHEGIRDIVLCVGHLADQIESYVGDGARFGLKVSYSEERDGLLGTAGALKQAEPLLADRFFVINGDSYLLLDYRAVMAYARCLGCLGLMVVYHNRNQIGPSNVALEGSFVSIYDKEGRSPGLEYIDFGATVLRKEALALLPAGVPVSQGELCQMLIDRRQLAALRTPQRFYEVGSPRGLHEFQEVVASGVVQT